jgi:hypothetical protein
VNKWSDRKTENKEYNGFFFLPEEIFVSIEAALCKGKGVALIDALHEEALVPVFRGSRFTRDTEMWSCR